MPLEKLMLLTFKDFFVAYLAMNISQAEELESIENMEYIIVRFIVKIDNLNVTVYMSYSKKCLSKIHNKMNQKQGKNEKVDLEKFEEFAITVTNELLNKLKRYAGEHDTRDVAFSTTLVCDKVLDTVYSTKRYFKVDNEYFIAEY